LDKSRILGATLIVLCLVLAVAPRVEGVGSGVEYNAAFVTVPGELLGSVETYLIPMNVSDPTLLSEANVYVLVQGVPRLVYLFSRVPPLVAVLEPSAYNAEYDVWYGGGNPYPSMLATPGTSNSFWLAFDDFDYPTGFWLNSSVSISGSRAYIQPGGYLQLSNSYSSRTAHVWEVYGRRALVISLPQAYSQFITLYFTADNFTDMGLIQDGSDIFFLDPSGSCLYYSVLYLDKTAGALYVAVNPDGNTAVYMLYGGVNSCPGYGVS